MSTLSLGPNDLVSHGIRIGIDTYPSIQIPDVQTKLSVFADEVRNRWPVLFDKLEASSSEFVISKVFRSPTDSRTTTTAPTFALAARGPVFYRPLLLPPPVGEVGNEEDYIELFPELREAFLRSVGGPDCLRIGLVRELLFGTGQTACYEFLTPEASFAEATLIGGMGVYVYRNGSCNVRITLDAVTISRTTQLPVGQTVTQAQGHGLKVTLDVNNHDLRALSDADMEGVLDYARSFWPDRMLEYVNRLGDTE